MSLKAEIIAVVGEMQHKREQAEAKRKMLIAKKIKQQADLFKKAHELAKDIASKYEVDYKEQFKLCLEMVIEDSKNEVSYPELLIKEFGGVKWEKDNMSRIYFGKASDLENLCERFDLYTSNYFDECRFFYDLNHNEFVAYSLNRRGKGKRELEKLAEKMLEFKK